MERAKLNLSSRVVYVLFGYYFIVFLAGIAASIICLSTDWWETNTDYSLAKVIVGSIGMCLVGSSIFYTRKLYKSCINGEFSQLDGDHLNQIGTTVYYFARPVFSIGFAIIIVVGLKSGHFLISKDESLNADNFLYACMFLSFFAGFSAGRFIKRLEGKSGSILGLDGDSDNE